MFRRIRALLFATLLAAYWPSILLADEPTAAIEPPEIVFDAPPAQREVKQRAVDTKTITVYESKVFPGFRPCTTDDYRNIDYDPLACQDEDVSRMLSTREPGRSYKVIVGDDVVPQGNIYKLRFERFKRKK